MFWLRAYGSYDPSDLPLEELDARRNGEVLRIAELLEVTTEGLSPDHIAGAVAQTIRVSGQPCLWIVDDLPSGLNAQQVRRWLSPHPLARTLFTTRSQAYGALAAAVDLDVLGDQDAYELLKMHRSPRSEEEVQAAFGIVEALGRHALAIDVAGAALSTHGLVSYADFLRNLSEPDEDELELVAELADALPDMKPALAVRCCAASGRSRSKARTSYG